MQLNPKVEAWCAALESGEYKQGKSELYSEVDDAYCCLGVLCKINGIPNSVMIEHKTLYFVPELVAEVGLRSSTGNALVNEVTERYGSGSLVGINDSGKYTFPEIAAIIRTGVFTKNEESSNE